MAFNTANTPQSGQAEISSFNLLPPDVIQSEATLLPRWNFVNSQIAGDGMRAEEEERQTEGEEMSVRERCDGALYERPLGLH